jgi:outer membrane receptor for ferrienterochelin and colicin
VITRRPEFEFGGDVELTGTNFDGYDASVAINGPLVDDKLAARLYMSHRNATACMK